MRGGGLQTPSKWLQQCQGLLATTLPSSWHCPDGQDSASTLLVLCGTWTQLGHHWGWGKPGSFHCSCGCSLLQRGRAEELEAMTFQALQMFSQWM